ncbi:MAG: hypothetical protein AB7P03_15505 [Kofleriaceae bacterium]
MTSDAVVVSTAIGAPLLAEIRRACDTLGVESVEARELGSPLPDRTIAIVAALPPGERKIPADVAAAADGSDGVKILLCSGEPMVKPTASLHGGRVVLLAPPYDRRRLISCMRQITGRELGTDRTDRQDQGESLRTDWWLAWGRHPKHAWRIESLESEDLTIVLKSGKPMPQLTTRVAEVFRESGDREREAKLAEALGDGGAIHLSPVVGEWIVFWPERRDGLWLCSPWRIPARWSLAGVVDANKQRLVRVAAYPGDVMMCAIAESSLPSVDRALNALAGGASDAYAVLREACGVDQLLTSIVEVR